MIRISVDGTTVEWETAMDGPWRIRITFHGSDFYCDTPSPITELRALARVCSLAVSVLTEDKK